MIALAARSSRGVYPAELQAYFVKSGRCTAGVATHYPPATVLTAQPTHQALAKGFTIGMRFHLAPVVRLADAKPMQLGHAARADAAWRIYAFADASAERLRALADFLAESPASPIRSFTPKGADIDSVIDLRAVFQQGHRDIEVDKLRRRCCAARSAAEQEAADFRLRFSAGLCPGRRRGADRW